MLLIGKVVVVIGGGSGIGWVISLQLVNDGVVVLVWDLNVESVEQIVVMIVDVGGKVIVCVGDVLVKVDIVYVVVVIC